MMVHIEKGQHLIQNLNIYLVTSLLCWFDFTFSKGDHLLKDFDLFTPRILEATAPTGQVQVSRWDCVGSEMVNQTSEVCW